MSVFEAYAAVSLSTGLGVLGLLVAVAGLGLLVLTVMPQGLRRLAAWSLVASSMVLVNYWTAQSPVGFRMLATCGVLLWAMKVVVSVESSSERLGGLSWPRWLAFTSLWVGMRPSLFAKRQPGLSYVRLLLRGTVFLAAGAALLWLARSAGLSDAELASGSAASLGVTAIALIGLSFMLHFGVFNLATAGWRCFGFRCRPLFRAPILSRSLEEFWGQRWNLAFSEMAGLSVYRPLSVRHGKAQASTAAFLFSGLLHEIAISVPANAGYGLPMLYFGIHAVGIALEKRMARRGRPIHSRGTLARVWVWLFIVLPLPILFHEPFLRGVVWPFVVRP